MTKRELMEEYWKILPVNPRAAYAMLSQNFNPVIVKMIGYIPLKKDAGRLSAYMHSQRDYSLKLIPLDEETLEPVIRRNVFGYSDNLQGLGKWVKREINAVGQLNSKGADIEEIVESLKDILFVCPSINLIVHVGDESGTTNCVQTILVKNGEITIYPPKVEKFNWLEPEEITKRLEGTQTKFIGGKRPHGYTGSSAEGYRWFDKDFDEDEANRQWLRICKGKREKKNGN